MNAVQLPQAWAAYCVKVHVDGALRHAFGAADVDDLRALVRMVALMMFGRTPPPGHVQFQVLNVLTQRWVDPSLPAPDVDTQVRWPADWTGWMNMELKVHGGLGGEL